MPIDVLIGAGLLRVPSQPVFHLAFEQDAVDVPFEGMSKIFEDCEFRRLSGGKLDRPAERCSSVSAAVQEERRNVGPA